MGSEREQILKVLRGYADFLDSGVDDLPDREAAFNIGGAAHIRKICDAIERGEHLTTERADNG